PAYTNFSEQPEKVMACTLRFASRLITAIPCRRFNPLNWRSKPLNPGSRSLRNRQARLADLIATELNLGSIIRSVYTWRSASRYEGRVEQYANDVVCGLIRCFGNDGND